MPIRRLEDLSRAELARLGREFMLYGHTYDRALMPQVGMRLGGGKEIEPLSIWEWKGASPNYTRRMKRLMKIEGDDVTAIVKALQLDVGFPHEYMDVQFELKPDGSAEFWLNHCGALMDVEKRGESAVVMMCHRIEDPTFDATAFATNPRARIRPLHRPPRRPSDRAPHCHWTIEIDPANEPVAPVAQTAAVADLPLARAANEREPEGDPCGCIDYAGAFDPAFRLGDLSTAALAAVAREFQIQTHLLASSAELALGARFGSGKAREILGQQWIAVAWVAGQRLARALGRTEGGAAAVADVLRLHAALPPGFRRTAEIRADRVRLGLEAASRDLLDPEQPGWIGLLLRGTGRGIEAAAQAVDPRARLEALAVRDGCVTLELSLDPARAPAEAPKETAFMRLSTATAWVFDTSEARLGR